MNWIVGGADVAAGGVIMFWLNRRAFNRRTIMGGQVFPTYGRALATRALEGIARAGAWGIVALGIYTMARPFLSF